MHNHTTVYPADTEGLHKLACYLMRSPVNLSRLRYHPQSQLILYEPKAGHDVDEEAELIYRIYEVDPLTCPRCQCSMKLLGFITQPAVIRRILDHLDANARERAPPSQLTSTAHWDFPSITSYPFASKPLPTRKGHPSLTAARTVSLRDGPLRL